ncbi:hypothetical protein [Agitococcus lubricus]|uniref:Uncharacterized protein n=1 Tax=Agitococcus lubricus TaxID=1077255 RepID=A0A2T5J333_9GAMM|nr:hypothetical protein [Agitococcus lubricus]PTQ91039.1 hypothetical protein C8N29_101111 [Agitococcus lubricus]
MLALTIITTLILVMMTRHRIWIYSATMGALFALGLWQLICFFDAILPPSWQAFNGVLAVLMVAIVLLPWLNSQEKRLAKQQSEQKALNK